MRIKIDETEEGRERGDNRRRRNGGGREVKEGEKGERIEKY
jgi:hypothetical protein